MSTIISPRQIGIELAQAILKETTLQRPIQKRSRATNLVKKPPDRKTLIFSELSKTDPRFVSFKKYAKAERGVDIADSDNLPDIDQGLCIACIKFNTMSGLSIEHATSYEKISYNSSRLLNFLNKKENKEIAEAFLSYSQANLNGNKVSDFFGRSGADIQAKGYLYTVCYNQLTNLWLTCQPCNNEKEQYPDDLEWFKTTPLFKGKFLKEIEEVGGIKNGALFEYVPKSKSEKSIILANEYIIFAGQGTGLGEYTHHWFLNNREFILEQQRYFHRNIHTPSIDSSKELGDLMDSAEEDKARAKRKSMKKKNLHGAATFDPTHVLAHQGSDSDSDNPHQEAVKIEQTQETQIVMNERSHYIKDIIRIVEEKYSTEPDIKNFSEYIYERVVKQEISVEDTTNTYESLKKWLDSDEGLPEWSKIKAFIQDSLKTLTEKREIERKGKLAEREQKLEARKWAEGEREQKLEAIKWAEGEREQKLEAIKWAEGEREQKLEARKWAEGEREQKLEAIKRAEAAEQELAAYKLQQISRSIALAENLNTSSTEINQTGNITQDKLTEQNTLSTSNYLEDHNMGDSEQVAETDSSLEHDQDMNDEDNLNFGSPVIDSAIPSTNNNFSIQMAPMTQHLKRSPQILSEKSPSMVEPRAKQLGAFNNKRKQLSPSPVEQSAVAPNTTDNNNLNNLKNKKSKGHT